MLEDEGLVMYDYCLKSTIEPSSPVAGARSGIEQMLADISSAALPRTHDVL